MNGETENEEGRASLNRQQGDGGGSQGGEWLPRRSLVPAARALAGRLARLRLPPLSFSSPPIFLEHHSAAAAAQSALARKSPWLRFASAAGPLSYGYCRPGRGIASRTLSASSHLRASFARVFRRHVEGECPGRSLSLRSKA